jgi:3,5-epimerase/4-reductase
MRVLIYGSNGWIGQKFVEFMNNMNIKYYVGKCRCDSIDLENEINTINPTHVLSVIGRTHGIIDNKVCPTIDYLENNGKLIENVRDNLFAPVQMALLCDRKNIHFTYLGTGCIFEYENDYLFKENDLPNFFGSSYSVVKGFTDRLMHLFPSSVLNLRIRMPITDENSDRNFITKIISYEKICSIPNSMTVLNELLPIAIDMMVRYNIGTINLTNPGVISHNEILDMYKEIVDPEFTWKNFTIEEQDAILQSKRSNNHLDTTKLETLYPDVKNIKDAVKNILCNYKNKNIL